MRRRKARAAVLNQAHDRERRNKFLLAALVVVTIGLMLGNALAAGSNRPLNEQPQNSATTSSEYEAALEAIEAKNYAGAITELDKANAKYPDNADVLNYLGYCNRKLGENDKSMDYYQQALAIDPAHRGVHEYLGELYLQMSDLPKAETELTALASLCPTGCEEHDDLKAAIDAHKAAHASN